MSTVPIQDPNRGFRLWAINEIYTGPLGGGRNVPNVNDLVVDLSRGFFKVTDVNSTTSLSELVVWTIPEQNELSQADILLGVGPGYSSESYRAYINTTVIPHTLDVDSRLHIYGSDASYVKIFRGTDVSVNGTVISAMYDQNNEFVSENVPLETVAIETGDSLAIKTPKTAFTNYTVDDGEVVTVVIYSDVGNVIGLNRLLVMNTAFVRRLESNKKHITNVELETPFLSLSETDTLIVPANVPQDALMLTARIYYTDGSSIRRPIDGTKVRLYGLNSALTTIPGTVWDMTLIYVLGPDESSINAITGGGHSNGHVASSYQLKTSAALSEYTVKLFVVPTWKNLTQGWGLEYFLYDLDRGSYHYATPYVMPGVNTAPFQPLLYGVDQALAVTVNLRDIDVSLPQFTFSQSFNIALMTNGITDSTGFILRYTTSQVTQYGQNLSCRVTNVGGSNWTLDLTCGETLLSAWLARVYNPILPLFDSATEGGPLQPTHFIVSINGINTEYPIAMWDSALPSETAGSLGQATIIHWVRKVNEESLHLGASPLKIFHVN